MKISHKEASEVNAGDIIEKCGANWLVLRAITTARGPFCAREFLCSPVSEIHGLETVYWEEYFETVLTVWIASEIQPET